MSGVKVPFGSDAFTKDEKEAVLAVLDSNWASKGPVCEEFEARLGKYLGSNVALVNTGSAALMVALLANGVKAGDAVLVPDFTFVATASVPAILGCKIVPVDADQETFNIDLWKVKDAPRPLTMATDVAGLPTQFEVNLEDAAEALGASTNSGKVGGRKFDHLTTFSFQATKQLSTVEGGAIASRDEELIDKCRRIADYGRTETRYLHSELGMNFRMTDIQAALGLVRLRTLDRTLQRRADIADRYWRSLSDILTPQKQPPYATRHAWWTFLAIVRDGKRDSLLKKLNGAGVDARAPWVPIHRQPCFAEFYDIEADKQFRDTVYPNSTHVWRNGIMLPISNTMTDEQVEFVISTALS